MHLEKRNVEIVIIVKKMKTMFNEFFLKYGKSLIQIYILQNIIMTCGLDYEKHI